MMNNAKIKQHLESFVSGVERQEFGCTSIMRHCKIGYNEAFRVLEMGFNTRVFERCKQPYRAIISYASV